MQLQDKDMHIIDKIHVHPLLNAEEEACEMLMIILGGAARAAYELKIYTDYMLLEKAGLQ